MNNLIIRLSNNIGNQMFMYAAAYSLSKKLNRNLYIDNQSAYIDNKIHKYSLDIFNYSANIAPTSLKFLGLSGYFKRKFLKKINYYKKIKNFYIEPKSENKITSFIDFNVKNLFSENLFLEGYFESEKYFQAFSSDIKNEFKFKMIDLYKENNFYNDIKNSNSVSICIRQHRFSERLRPTNAKDIENSKTFTYDQISYIKKAINIIKKKINNPKFFLWSNDHSDLSDHFPNDHFTYVSSESTNNDLFLMTQAKHFIVVPSTFNWWGSWLSDYDNKIILRPSKHLFSNFQVSNVDYWPENWIEVN